MNAEQARKLAEENLRGPVIAPILTYIEEKIRKTAKAGNRELVHPLDGYTPQPSAGYERAVWRELEARGFTVTHHPDPDPGHPASRPYTSIEW